MKPATTKIQIKNKSDNSNETQSSNEQVEHSDKTITVAEAKSIVYNSANSQSFKSICPK